MLSASYKVYAWKQGTSHALGIAKDPLQCSGLAFCSEPQLVQLHLEVPIQWVFTLIQSEFASHFQFFLPVLLPVSFP